MQFIRSIISSIFCQKEETEEDEYTLMLRAVQENGECLILVPLRFRTYELCLAAVQAPGIEMMLYVPDEHKTYELCLAAVKNDPFALRDVPLEHRTLELCTASLQSQGGSSLQHVPIHFRTYDFCVEAVKQHSSALQYVPEEFVGDQFFVNAEQQRCFAVQCILDDLDNQEL